MFRIDQVTPGNGTLNRSRHDLIAGEIISLVVPTPLAGAVYTWEIIDQAGSAAVLSSTSGTTVSIGLAGAIVALCAFSIRCTRTIGGSSTFTDRCCSVRGPGGLRPFLFREAANQEASQSETDTDSSTDNALYANLAGKGVSEQNWRGWAEPLWEHTKALDAHLASIANPHSVTAAQVGAVPTARTVSTTAPLTGGGALSGNLTLALSAATAADPGSMSAADFVRLRDIDLNVYVSEPALTRTLAANPTDRGKTIRRTNAAANTYTIPKDATYAAPIGTTIIMTWEGVGQPSFASEDVNVILWGSPTGPSVQTTELKCARLGGKIIAEKTDVNKWLISGEKAA